MDRRPFDPRAVANLMLDMAEQDGLRVTNLALQKLLYFAHARHLVRTNKPLVDGHFEAWTYGPVHPAVYQAFKSEDDKPIRKRAVSRNVMTGEIRELPSPNDPALRQELREVLISYGRLSPGRLVDISHAKDGPWHFVVNNARTSVALGLRISDNVTIDKFKHLKVSVGLEARSGEPDEDTPLA